MTLSLTLISFILFALALQGFIISGLLFYSSKTIKSNRWLGALVFIVSDAILIIEFDHMGILDRYPISRLLVPHFAFAFGPVIYLYTKSLIAGPQKISMGKNWLHFLPLLIDFKAQLIFLIYTSGLLYIPVFQNFYFDPSTQHFLFGSQLYIALSTLISVVTYVVVTYITIIRHQKSTVLPANKLKDLKWIKTILYTLFALIILWVSAFKLSAQEQWGQYLVLLPLVGGVYLLGMVAWRRQAHMTVDEKEEYTQKPAKAYFTPGESDIYIQRLDDLMAKRQFYLNPVLKVDDVAAELLISEKALSNLINQHLVKNFNDYVNEYRIAEVKLRLADPHHRNFTIAAIALDCGFNSLATFQRAFKQFTGTTPSRFQNDSFSAQLSVK